MKVCVKERGRQKISECLYVFVYEKRECVCRREREGNRVTESEWLCAYEKERDSERMRESLKDVHFLM